MTDRWLEAPLTFRCAEAELLGIVHHATQGPARLGVMVVVGGPQYRVGSHRQFTLMARALAASGYPVMRFDYRGMGDSDGEPRGFMAVAEDLRVALDAFQRAVPSLESVVMWGLCDAASAVLMVGGQDPRVAGLVLVNPWVRSASGESRAYLRHYYLRRLLQPTFWGKVLSGEFSPIQALNELYRKIRLARDARPADRPARQMSFVDHMLTGLDSFHGPVLMQISGRDLTAAEFMDLAATAPGWQRAMSRRNVVLSRLESADHTFSARADLDRATEQCRAWLEARVSVGVSSNGVSADAAIVAR